MTEEQQEKAARTEALFRGVNERIAESAARFGSDDASFVCECDDAECAHRIQATLDEYHGVRQDPARFLVLDGHVDPEIERVATRTRRFTIVEKITPLVRATVERLDPRAQQA